MQLFMACTVTRHFLLGIMKKDLRSYNFNNIYADADAHGLSYTYEFSDNVPNRPSESAWLTLSSEVGDTIFVKTASLGGGEIYIDELDGIKTYIDGKYFYLLVRVAANFLPSIKNMLPGTYSVADSSSGESLITVRSSTPIDTDLVSKVRTANGVLYVRSVNPVYDIIPLDNPEMPFNTAKEMFSYAAEKRISLWQAALDYEQAISGLSSKELMDIAESLWDLSIHSAQEGYKVTSFEGNTKPHAAQAKSRYEKRGPSLRWALPTKPPPMHLPSWNMLQLTVSLYVCLPEVHQVFLFLLFATLPKRWGRPKRIASKHCWSLASSASSTIQPTTMVLGAARQKSV